MAIVKTWLYMVTSVLNKAKVVDPTIEEPTLVLVVLVVAPFLPLTLCFFFS